MTKRIENKGMLKRVFGVLVVLLIASAMLVGAASAAANWTDAGNFNATWYVDEGGDSATTYHIYDAASLAAFSEKVTLNTTKSDFSGKTVLLMDNIDLAGNNWTAIGYHKSDADMAPFRGTFNGQNYTISNLNVYAPEDNNQGLFGYTQDTAVLKNVFLHDVTVIGQANVGSLAGSAYTGKLIENCHVSGTIKIQGNCQVGGLIGYGYANPITNCSVIGEDPTSYVKGIYKKADLEGDNIGGIIGLPGEGHKDYSKWYTDIYVSGSRKVGGLAGVLHYSNTISESSASGDVALEYFEDYTTDKPLSVGALFGDVQAKSGYTLAEIKETTASGNIIIPEGDAPNGASVSAGLIGAVRNDGYNQDADLETLSGMVEDSTYIISDETLQALYNSGNMKTAGIGSVAESEAAEPYTILIIGATSGTEWDGNKVNITAGGNYKTMKNDEIIICAGSNSSVVLNGVALNTNELTTSGDLSAAKDKTGNLTAVVSSQTADFIKYEVNWTITGDAIEFENAAKVNSSLSGEKVQYKAVKAGTATITVEAAGVKDTLTITVTEPAKPVVTLTATPETDGNVSIALGSGDKVVNATDGTELNIGDTIAGGSSATIVTNGVNITLTYNESGATYKTEGSTNYLNGSVVSMKVIYPETYAAAPNMAVNYTVTLNLNATKALNGAIILPTLDASFNQSAANKIDQNSYKILSMLTAIENAAAVNLNLTEVDSIEITFMITDSNKFDLTKLHVFHVGDGNPEELQSGVTKTENKVTIKGNEFSSYVLTEEIPVVPPQPQTPSSSSSSSGSSVWLQEPATPTPTPTPTETVTPTDAVPTDIPVTQPTATPASPGFGILAALAGLGAVAVLRRK